MWILYAILACIGITFACIPMRIYGFGYKSYFLYLIIVAFTSGWMLPLTYDKSPTFYQAWFLTTALLTIFGMLPSWFIFGESIKLIHFIGIGLCLIGGYLLIK